jgi:hypothetical protein
MKKTLILVLLVLLAIPLVANADGATTYTEFEYEVIDDDWIGCGTTVHVTGMIQYFGHVTITPEGQRVLSSSGSHQQGLRATDADGNMYVGVERDHSSGFYESQDGRRISTETRIISFIGRGQAPNITWHRTIHLALNANNELVVEFSDSRFECH